MNIPSKYPRIITPFQNSKKVYCHLLQLVFIEYLPNFYNQSTIMFSLSKDVIRKLIIAPATIRVHTVY